MVDNRLREDERKQEAHAFLTADAAELDEGFSRRFRQIVTAAHEILPNGHMHCVVDGVSATKVMNIEVEDAFARAAAMRRCGAGASSPLPCVMFGAVALTLQCSKFKLVFVAVPVAVSVFVELPGSFLHRSAIWAGIIGQQAYIGRAQKPSCKAVPEETCPDFTEKTCFCCSKD